MLFWKGQGAHGPAQPIVGCKHQQGSLIHFLSVAVLCLAVIITVNTKIIPVTSSPCSQILLSSKTDTVHIQGICRAGVPAAAITSCNVLKQALSACRWRPKKVCSAGSGQHPFQGDLPPQESAFGRKHHERRHTQSVT